MARFAGLTVPAYPSPRPPASTVWRASQAVSQACRRSRLTLSTLGEQPLDFLPQLQPAIKPGRPQPFPGQFSPRRESRSARHDFRPAVKAALRRNRAPIHSRSSAPCSKARSRPRRPPQACRRACASRSRVSARGHCARAPAISWNSDRASVSIRVSAWPRLPSASAATSAQILAGSRSGRPRLRSRPPSPLRQRRQRQRAGSASGWSAAAVPAHG